MAVVMNHQAALATLTRPNINDTGSITLALIDGRSMSIKNKNVNKPQVCLSFCLACHFKYNNAEKNRKNLF